MSLIQKGQNIAVVMRAGGVWFANGKFGVTWKLVQAVVQPRATLKGRCHISLGSAERDLMRQSAEADNGDDDEVVSTQANDTDEEVEPEPEPEPEPVPEPKKPAAKACCPKEEDG